MATLESQLAAPVAKRRAVGTAIALFGCICGVIFLIAGLGKATDPSELSRVFEFYRFPKALSDVAVWLVTLGEVALGMLLIIKPLSRPILLTLGGLLVFYSGNLAVFLLSEHPPDCGCLSLVQAYEQGRHGNVVGLVRNSILLVGVGGALAYTWPRRAGRASSNGGESPFR